MNVVNILSLCTLSLLCTQKALAWNDLCREAIESTAMSAITLDRLRRLKVLLRGHDLVDYTWWAAEVMRRIPQSEPLHKQPQTDTTCATFDSTCPNGMCLIGGVKFFFAKLMNSGYSISPTQPKFELPPMKYPRDIFFAPSDNLKYLVVLLADMHYPFNLDLKSSDSIGQRKVDLSDFPMWESESMAKLGTTQPALEEFVSKVYMPHYIETNGDSWYGAWTNVEVLGSRYKVEQESFNRNTWDNFEIWATETANLNCAQLITNNDYVEHSNTIKLSDALLERIGMLLRFQIVLAGARIAIVINYILSHREIAYCNKTGMIIEKDPSLAYKAEDYGFMVLVLFTILVLMACVYFTCLAFKQMYNDNIRIHVDYAILRMRERYRQRHKPDLVTHEE